MKVTLATVGSRGDVQPMIALAQALQRRGHQPLIAAPPNFEKWVRSHQVPFAPLGCDMQAWIAENAKLVSGNPIKLFKGMTQYFNEHLPAQFRDLVAAGQGTDAIVIAGLAFSGPSVAEHLKVPILAVAYTPSILPASAHPPPTIPWHGLPAWMNDLLWRASNFVGSTMVLDALNEGRARLKLEPVVNLGPHLYEEAPFIIAADELLFPPDAGWNERHRYANFLYYDDPSPLDGELDAWLKDGEAPVFVGFGSMSGDGIDRVAAMMTQAIVKSGRRCLVGAGWSGLGGGELPKGWRQVREAPHALLFPRMAVVVHHGGSGTTANALRAGVPQVILPLILDQFYHAHRLHVAGLAPKPTPMESITASKLAAAIEEALALPGGVRQATAERLRASDGAGQIVSRIEALRR
jgi:UDP:flavonoid glycosyltransferase YjiC (YdhE family)